MRCSTVISDAHTLAHPKRFTNSLDWTNIFFPLPIASLTKLAMAMVFLDEGVDFSRQMTILASDDRIGGKLYLYPGELVTVKDLFFTTMVGSANNSTIALVRSTGLKEAEFVARMNAKVQGLGFTNTVFYDPTGLNPRNFSTAHEIAMLFQEALGYTEISETLREPVYEFTTLNTHQSHRIVNTNELLESFLAVPPFAMLGGKTGYLDEARYCFVAKARKENKEVVVVVLGSESSEARFQEAKGLLFWGLDH
jgi:D-alanyl-D-alanine endopeptidase (penicillin-binding protein 7)